MVRGSRVRDQMYRNIIFPLDKIIDDYRGGKTMSDIAVEWGTTNDTLKSYLVKYGFNGFRTQSESVRLSRFRYPPKRHSQETKDKISRTKRGTLLSAESILKRKLTMERKFLARLSTAENDGLSRLYLEGYSLEMLHKKFGLCNGVIQRHLTSMGIKLRNRSENIKLMYQNKIRIPGIGERSTNWKGGRRKGDYIEVWDYETQKYIKEHKIVWERVNNKKLPKGWVIHHLNRVGTDNRPENLVAMSSQKHWQVLAEKARRIRELEEKIRLLESEFVYNIEMFRSNN